MTVDARHEKRIHLVQNIFAKSYDPNEEKIKFPNKEHAETTTDLFNNIELIDKIISSHAPKYPLNKIARIDLAILRLAIYELTIDKKEPVKVVINEAVELAKEMGNDRSFAFINAVLGSAVNEIKNEASE